MALQADFELLVAIQFRGIRDGVARIFGMRLSRPVASLAIDSLGEAAIRLRRISVMAKLTGIGDFSREIGMIRTVITRAHPPGARTLRIPTERKLDQTEGGKDHPDFYLVG